MFTPIIRIVLVILSLIAAIYFYSKKDYVNMSMMLVACGLFIYGYFKYGTIYAAFQQIKKNNIKKAEKLISKVKNPNKLTKREKSYYYFTTGIIALEKKKFEKSHSDLTQALDIGLRTENDKSIVLLNLANIELLREDHNKAIEYIKILKQLKLKPIVELETNRIEKEIKTSKNNV
ncbi:tetratricopeptide repeat protein [Mesonia aquimarina]|uniref:hypothetical protein n=1 Tax=Mesonia aquimarina TaxID=1504967 RepID=UPI000EF5F743|nr:hypothetical protein [Mesonia aquimarina]